MICLIIMSCLLFVSNIDAMNLEDNTTSSGEYVLLANDSSAELDDFSHNCADIANTLKLVGYVIIIVKIAIPLIIIVKSSLSLITTVTSGTPDEVKKGLINLAYSVAGAVLIFYVPTIIDTIFGFVNSYNKTSDAEICSACVFDPLGGNCHS